MTGFKIKVKNVKFKPGLKPTLEKTYGHLPVNKRIALSKSKKVKPAKRIIHD